MASRSSLGVPIAASRVATVRRKSCGVGGSFVQEFWSLSFSFIATAHFDESGQRLRLIADNSPTEAGQ